jgi:hypothetical protein
MLPDFYVSEMSQEWKARPFESAKTSKYFIFAKTQKDCLQNPSASAEYKQFGLKFMSGDQGDQGPML